MKEQKLLYRKAEVGDIPGLKALGLAAFGQFCSVLTEKDWKDFSAFLDDEANYWKLLEDATCFLCQCDELIVGMAFLIPSGHPTDLFDANWSYIRMVGVHPEYQGRGIAKRLTHLCLNVARRTNEEVVALHTSDFMDTARHIYEKAGFRSVKELKRYGRTYWVYIKKLKEEYGH